ncbi:hypothetical protein R1T08_15450 [Streptomyces sp. SBC-4]|nr:hypothetical protein [Streptomyces sp. SBC-4]MDV5145568.1 hypothetical protein [Streptomyces sp. SBC-4]
MTTPPSLVLRGSGVTVLRFEGGAVNLGRATETHDIPLAAIELVRAEGRAVAIELTAPDGVEPTAYRVEDVSEVAATAFAEAVNASLPARTEPVDGSALVTTYTRTATPAPRVSRRTVLGIATAVPVLALDVFLGVAGRLEYALMFWLSAVVAAVGGFLVLTMSQGLYRMRYLPKHGITVVARFSHCTNNTRVYRYTDTEGISRTYTNNVGGQTVELSYDPRNPKVAVHQEGLYVRGMMSLMTLVGCGLACGGLYGIGWLVVTTLKG